MFLLMAAVAGFLAALLIHRPTWTARLNDPALTLAAGVLGAFALTGFCLVFLDSDIRNMMLIVLGLFWFGSLLPGALQAFALRVPWWRGAAGIFFEMAPAFLTGAAVNLSMQQTIPWFVERFPDVYALINSFLGTLVITLLLLAIVRPLDMVYRRPGNST